VHFFTEHNLFLFLQSVESIDGGKLFASALGDVDSAAGCLRYFAGWCDKEHGKTIPAGEYKMVFHVQTWF